VADLLALVEMLGREIAASLLELLRLALAAAAGSP